MRYCPLVLISVHLQVRVHVDDLASDEAGERFRRDIRQQVQDVIVDGIADWRTAGTRGSNAGLSGCARWPRVRAPDAIRDAKETPASVAHHSA